MRAFCYDWGDSLQGIESACMKCRHYDWSEFRCCAAFPQGIPASIWSGDHRHDLPVRGDGGIRFEAIHRR